MMDKVKIPSNKDKATKSGTFKIQRYSIYKL